MIYLVYSFIPSKDSWVQTYVYEKKHFKYLWVAKLYRFYKKNVYN